MVLVDYFFNNEGCYFFVVFGNNDVIFIMVGIFYEDPFSLKKSVYFIIKLANFS